MQKRHLLIVIFKDNKLSREDFLEVKAKKNEATTGKETRKEFVWGLRVPRSVNTHWKMLAAVTEVPVYRLVAYVLFDWFHQNERIFADADTKKAFAERVRRFDMESPYEVGSGEPLKSVKKRMKL